VAGLYEKGRPEYPEEAVRFLVSRLELGRGARVVDLAAGTGKFTRALVPFGFALTAVEPSAGMRAEFEQRVPGVPVLDGTAEAIPLPDRSCDAVLVAQAFHWFRAAPALDEIARVLRPAAGLGILFNLRDETVPFVHQLTEIVQAHRPPDPPSVRDGAWRAGLLAHPKFDRVEEKSFRYVQRTDADGVVARMLSVSFIAGATEPVRRQVESDIRALLDTDERTAGRAVIDLPYDTIACVARAKGS
jgi:ubiquinone/menaquinone biosynthesis C-methylase UbiE